MWRAIFILFLLAGCMVTRGPYTIFAPMDSDLFQIVTIEKITDKNLPVHIYIEGDGHAFDATGRPTSDPTPHGRFMRDLAAADTGPNVVYLARPCQFEMDKTCTQDDWTSGRFSRRAIDSMAVAVMHIAAGRPVVLIGYSGGALISGLIIQNYPQINVRKWITIAGVLNHSDWTAYFGDNALSHSLDLNGLPNITQVHYVAQNDKTVPIELSEKWTQGKNLIVVPNAKHNKFPKLKLDFSVVKI